MAHNKIITIRPGRASMAAQTLPMFVGISGESAGATKLCMYKIVIPPGAKAEPHSHASHETAIYVLKGRVETKYGQDLKESVINEAGDFIFIPPGLPHQPINLSDTEFAEGIVARSDPNEIESVIPYNIQVDSK